MVSTILLRFIVATEHLGRNAGGNADRLRQDGLLVIFQSNAPFHELE